MDNINNKKILPQISAPFSYLANELNDKQQPYQMIGANINDVKPLNPIIDSDIVDLFVNKLKNGEELKAILLDKDNNIMDGKHRYVAYIMNNSTHVPAIKLMCDKDVAIDHLKDIQSKYDSENNSKFLNTLFEDEDTSIYTPEKKLATTKNKIKAFRMKPIIYHSASGNFFSLKELPSYKPYEIEFSNLLNSDVIDKNIKEDKNPPFALAKAWFPNLNFKEKAKSMEMTLPNFINTIVAEKARTKGIDGIVYGDKLLQSIDEK